MTLLSVIVPTHNRQQYAISAIRALLDGFPDIEVVVSDTSDDASLLTKLDEPQVCGRFVYERPRHARNIVANYEHGYRHASGEYLVFLGDDDGVGPHVTAVAQWAKQEGIEAISCSLPASYGWPDFRSAVFGSGYAATLSIRDFSGACRPLDTIATLRAAAKNLGGGPMDMPRAYLGMLSRALADRIVSRYGSLFGGISPDIYSASLIAVESTKTVLLDYPFVLPGSSGASGSGLGASRRHIGGLWSTPHIASFPGLQWHSFVPEFYSVGTVWSFTLVRALEVIDRPDLAPDFPRLYVKSLLLHPQYWREVLAAGHSWLAATPMRTAAPAMLSAVMSEMGFQARRVLRRVRNPKATGDALAIRDISTVADAFVQLAQIVAARPEALPVVLRKL